MAKLKHNPMDNPQMDYAAVALGYMKHPEESLVKIANILADELEATGDGNAPDGIRLYTVTEGSGKGNAVFVAMGLREKYIRYLNGAHLYYFTSNGYYNSSRFLALDFYRYDPTRQNRISSISNMCSILPAVDE